MQIILHTFLLFFFVVFLFSNLHQFTLLTKWQGYWYIISKSVCYLKMLAGTWDAYPSISRSLKQKVRDWKWFFFCFFSTLKKKKKWNLLVQPKSATFFFFVTKHLFSIYSDLHSKAISYGSTDLRSWLSVVLKVSLFKEEYWICDQGDAGKELENYHWRWGRWRRVGFWSILWM